MANAGHFTSAINVIMTNTNADARSHFLITTKQMTKYGFSISTATHANNSGLLANAGTKSVYYLICLTSNAQLQVKKITIKNFTDSSTALKL